MKTRFTISNKLIVGFGILLLATLVNSLMIFSTLNDSQRINSEITEIYNPSVKNLQDLYSLVNNSQMLIKNWVFIEKQSDTPDKKKLHDLHDVDMPKLVDKLNENAKHWNENERLELDTIINIITENLFPQHRLIMESLSSFESYDDLMVLFEVTPLVEEGGDVIITTQTILQKVDKLSAVINSLSESANVEMDRSFKWFQKYIVFTMIFLGIFVFIVALITTRSIVIFIIKLKEFFILMTKGILPTEKLQTNNDEVGDMADALNIYIENMRRTSEFAVEIGKGIYSSQFEPLSQDDILGNTLIELRENLKKAQKENEERAKADNIRNWVTKGLADFGDILRQNSDNMDNLSRNVLKNIISYLNVNQGAIYILNETNDSHKFFEMKSAIAYNREKYLKTNFDSNEGLVGRCAFEKLPVYLKEIPEEYIKLTSGLGQAEPNYLLLVPFIFNDKVYGVIEIASFNEIPAHQIEFVTTLGENIASTISNVRINEQTGILLEESRLRSDELSAQEEELRQNMEELQATQEEAARRENEMVQTIEAINNTLGTIDIDRNGNIIAVNDNFLELSKMSTSALVGKQFREIFAPAGQIEREFAEIWANLAIGDNGTFITNYITADGELWFKHSLTPFRGHSGDLLKVIDLIINITETKNLEKEIESLR